MKNLSLIVFVVFLISSMLSAATITKGPWIQNVRTNAAIIMWETSVQTTGNTVDYGTTTSYGSTANISKDTNIYDTYYLHTVEITGLVTYTKYHFKVNSDSTPSKTGFFTTAPRKNSDYKIVIYGDSRTGHSVHNQICNSINAEDVTLVVHNGDYVGCGSTWSDWGNDFFTPAAVMLSNNAFIGCIGNHEASDSSCGSWENNNLYYSYFSLPTNNTGAPNEHPEAYYSYYYGDVHFIVLDSNDANDWEGSGYGVDYITGSPQYNWLHNELINNTSKWVVVLEHTPIVSSSYHGQWTSDEQQYIMPQLENYVANSGPLFVFDGDDHTFQHNFKDGVDYFVCGGAGAELYGNHYNTAALQYNVYTNSVHHYLTLDFTNGGNTITLKAHNPDSSVFYTTNFEYGEMSPYKTEKIIITNPDGEDDVAYNNFNIQYKIESPLPLDENSDVSLYYTRTSNDNLYTFINNVSCHLFGRSYQFLWNTSKMSSGKYYLTGVLSITNGKKITNKSPFPITIASSNSISFQPYPTPFTPGENILRIKYSMPADKSVSFFIYDLLGRQVRAITKPNSYGFSWDGKDDLGKVVPKGIYIVKMKVDNRMQKTYQKVVVK